MNDPLDRLPQVPVDWANHIIWGGALGLFGAGAGQLLSVPAPLAFGAGVALLVAALKKALDFVYEKESAAECVGKALITALWPLTMAMAGA